jgi:hypothetical protein
VRIAGRLLGEIRKTPLFMSKNGRETLLPINAFSVEQKSGNGLIWI